MVNILFKVRFLVASLMLSHCAVEVGNPGDSDETKKQSSLSLYLSKETSDLGDQFLLNIKSIQLTGYNQTTGLTSKIDSLSASTFDLFSGDDDGLTLMTKGQMVDEGIYTTAIIEFGDDAPLRLVNADGAKFPVDFEGGANKFIEVNMELDLYAESSGSVSYVLGLRIGDSLKLQEGKTDRYQFSPKGSMRNRDRNRNFRFDFGASEDTFVRLCAYFIEERAFAPHFERPGGLRPLEGLPEDRRLLPPPPRVADIDNIVVDEDVRCLNAYDTTRVVGQRAEFRQLPAAKYLFRAFKGDGTFINVRPMLPLVHRF